MSEQFYAVPGKHRGCCNGLSIQGKQDLRYARRGRGKVLKFEMFIGFVSDNVAHPQDDDESYEDILVNYS